MSSVARNAPCPAPSVRITLIDRIEAELNPRRLRDITESRLSHFKIGKAAGIKVYINPKDPEKVKYASAHDLRRAFGERWAARLMPAQLKELMRHESIETTLRFYVGTDA